MSINYKRSQQILYDGRMMSKNEARGVSLLDHLGISYSAWRLPNEVQDQGVNYQPDAVYERPDRVLVEVRGYGGPEADVKIQNLLCALRKIDFLYSFVIIGAGARNGRAKYYGVEGENLDAAMYICTSCRRGFLWASGELLCHFCHKNEFLVAAYLYWHEWQMMIEIDAYGERRLIPAMSFILKYLPEREPFFETLTATKEGSDTFRVRCRRHWRNGVWVTNTQSHKDSELIENNVLIAKGAKIMDNQKEIGFEKLVLYLRKHLVSTPGINENKKILKTSEKSYKKREDIINALKHARYVCFPELTEINEKTLERARAVIGFDYIRSVKRMPKQKQQDQTRTVQPIIQSVDFQKKLNEELQNERNKNAALEAEVVRLKTLIPVNPKKQRFLEIAARYGLVHQVWLDRLADVVVGSSFHPNFESFDFGVYAKEVYTVLAEYFGSNHTKGRANGDHHPHAFV